MSDRVKKLIEKYPNEIEQSIFLPMFLEALVGGGIELFDELRIAIEDAGVDLKDVDFTRLK